MDEKIKKGDFIELDYTAKITSTGSVFDTTIESDAKKHDIYNKDVKYLPMIVKVGEGHMVKGLDAFVVEKEPGSYTVELTPENAFGKKDAKLLRLISIAEFRKSNIQAMPGLEVELDGHRGVIRTVNGGRVIVDFNHPLSSQDITYAVTLKGVITDPKTKIETALNILQLPFDKVELVDGKASVSFKTKIPEDVSKPILDELKRLSDVNDIEFK